MEEEKIDFRKESPESCHLLDGRNRGTELQQSGSRIRSEGTYPYSRHGNQTDARQHGIRYHEHGQSAFPVLPGSYELRFDEGLSGTAFER